jgi:predicted permease
VVLQVAASVLLLVGAGLLTRTLWHASEIQLGFDPAHTVVGSTDLIRQGYDKNAAATLLDPMLDALRAQPGVESAALGPVPLQGNMSTSVKLEGYNAADGEPVAIEGLRVSPGYFATLRIPLLSGRDFKRSDAEGAPGAAIVSQGFAQKYWPRQNALGRHIEHVGIHDQTFEIVGIAGDTAGYDLRRGPRPVVYFPLDQSYLMFPWQPDITLLARGPGDPGQLMNALRRAVAGVDSALPLFRARTMQDQVAGVLGEEKFLARLLIVFAVIAVTLAAAGVFGLMSYNTERATHDFGIRMALGAQQHHVLWMVLRKALALAVAGAIIGLGAAVWLTRLLASLLFGVSPTDPLTFAAVGGMAICIALLACYLPARRAARTDPLIALRAE